MRYIFAPFFLIGDDVFINSLSFMVLSCKQCAVVPHTTAQVVFILILWLAALAAFDLATHGCNDKLRSLSPVSLTCSIASTTSCGARAVISVICY